MRKKTYLVEVRDTEGRLDFTGEQKVRKEHPYFFSKREFTMDDLCYFMSFGEGRDNPSGPVQLDAFMKEMGVTYREKTW